MIVFAENLTTIVKFWGITKIEMSGIIIRGEPKRGRQFWENLKRVRENGWVADPEAPNAAAAGTNAIVGASMMIRSCTKQFRCVGVEESARIKITTSWGCLRSRLVWNAPKISLSVARTLLPFVVLSTPLLLTLCCLLFFLTSLLTQLFLLFFFLYFSVCIIFFPLLLRRILSLSLSHLFCRGQRGESVT